jgi:succinate dehydrogenase hydrophobic anchor subunit
MSRGISYLVCWGHRVAGLILLVFLAFHVNTLSLLQDPVSYTGAMERLSRFPFTVLEWMLAAPLIFHALNGARVILYEWSVMEDPERALPLMWVISGLYMGLLALFMSSPSRAVPLGLFWLPLVCGAAILAYLTSRRVLSLGRRAFFWGLHRICAVFLLVILPAHMLVMHSVRGLARDAALVSGRLDNPWILSFDVAVMMVVTYHAGYGLFSILSDYIPWRALRVTVGILVWIGAGLLALWGGSVLWNV